MIDYTGGECMRLLILSIILSLGLFVGMGCNDGPPDHCKYMGELCYSYPQDYYKCREFDQLFGIYEYWYEIFEVDGWRVWYSYNTMFNYYCN
jgi:hypothetical protein